MRFLRPLFWILLFVGLTFCWFVLFEYGFSPSAFVEGARKEWGNLLELLR